MKMAEVDLMRVLEDARERVGLTDGFPNWRHRTGSVYAVKFVTLREEDCTPLVSYQGQYGGPVWTRPLPEFLDGRFTREKG